jgi:hypothetical protein
METSDVISFSCGRCGHATQVPSKHAGRRGRCGGCRVELRVPAAARTTVERCNGCGDRCRAGMRYCIRCTRPTVRRLVVVSAAFLVLGAPVAAVVGAINVAAAQNGSGLALMWMVAGLGGVAVVAGGIDLVRALIAHSAGEEEVKPFATQWVLQGL